MQVLQIFFFRVRMFLGNLKDKRSRNRGTQIMFEITWHKLWCILNESKEKEIYIWGDSELAQDIRKKLSLLDRAIGGLVDEKTSWEHIPEQIYLILPFLDENVLSKLSEKSLRMFRDYRVLQDFEWKNYLSCIFKEFSQAPSAYPVFNFDKQTSSIIMFVLTHKKCLIPDGCYSAIQVGSILNKKLPYLQDCTGDNISYKNKTFSELTGLYWIWKNAEVDVIGLCHYRRFFINESGDVLQAEEVDRLLKTYDIILPTPMTFNTKDKKCIPDSLSILTQYGQEHYIGDLISAEEYISQCYPAYSAAFREAIIETKCFGYNMMITHKEIFDAYCEWLFPILFYVEDRRNILWEDNYQRRAFGFLSERLLNVWLKRQKFKIKIMPVILQEYKK